MPQLSSTSRSEVRRRGRHKVYAAAEPHQENETGHHTSPLSTSMNGGSLGNGFSCEISGCVGEQVDGRNCSLAAAATGNLGTVGPGAEPPVAVASHAFAHKEPHAEILHDHQHNTGQETRADPPCGSFPVGEEVGVLSPEGGVGTCENFDRDDGSGPRSRCHGEKANTAGSRPESVKTNEGEADTLPDFFVLSDEYGPEGASTGRNQHDHDNDDVHELGGARFFGSPIDSSSSSNSSREQRGCQNRPPARRYSRNSRHEDGSLSGFAPRYEGDSGRASASASDNSDYWPSSSRGRRNKQRQPRPQQREYFGRRTRQSSRQPLLTALKRDARAASYKKLPAPGSAESEGTRRYRPASSRSSTRYTSSPLRRNPGGTENKNPHRRRRREVSRHKSRGSRRLVQTETETVSENMNHPLEEEMARLRRENEALKQQQEQPTR